jgi:hypothetical protein
VTRLGFEPSCASLANSVLHGVCRIYPIFFFENGAEQGVLNTL